jgi:hypothetical protein
VFYQTPNPKPRFISAVVVRRVRLELGGAGVHRLEHGGDAERLAGFADFGFGRVPEGGELAVGEPVLLRLQHHVGRDTLERAGRL